MARKKNKRVDVRNVPPIQRQNPQYGYGPQFIQLPPIIQPVIMMPYGDAPQQPPQYDDDDYFDDDDF